MIEQNLALTLFYNILIKLLLLYLLRLILARPVREKAQNMGRLILASKKKPLSPNCRNEWLTGS